jgi:hypothetical protein
MKIHRLLVTACALILLGTGTGCFRVSSDTQALRDAALESGFAQSREKIEIGAGFFTVGFAKLASRFVELPDEARLALSALRNAECAVYEIKHRRESLSSILTRADEAMEGRGYERLAGVIKDRKLVAVYVPHERSSSARVLQASVLVLDGQHLVCASAEANAGDLIELATSKLKLDGGGFGRREVAIADRQ